MRNKKIRKLKRAIYLLRDAFDHNQEAHKLSLLSQEAYYNNKHNEAECFSWEKTGKYVKKQAKIEEVLGLIKEFSLPIKYGYGFDDNAGKNLIYFSYNDEQISFHFFDEKIINKIKKYRGNWKGIKNERFPLLRD